MSILFWVAFTAFCLLALFRLFKGDVFGIYGYVLFGVYVPLGLFFVGWSGYVDPRIQTAFYVLFIQFSVVLCAFMITEGDYLKPLQGKIRSRRRGLVVVAMTFVFVACTLTENQMGSGVFLPALSGIDIHTYHAPIIVYVTKSIYVVCGANLFAIVSADRWWKRFLHIFLISVVLFVFVFGKSARIEVAMLLVQLAGLGLFLGGRAIWSHIGRIRPSVVIGSVALMLLVVRVFASVGDSRSSHYGQYDVADYGTSIDYTGPQLLGKWMSWYYGYFPLSFNNLNLSIGSSGIGHSLLGFDAFKWLYFGLFQFDNLLGMDAYNADHHSVYLIPQAIVTTGFWDIIYDFGYFSFLVFVLSLLYYRFLKKRVQSDHASLGDIGVYFYWVPTWFFMSFQNFSFDVFVASNIIFCYLLFPRLYYPPLRQEASLGSAGNVLSESFLEPTQNRRPR